MFENGPAKKKSIARSEKLQTTTVVCKIIEQVVSNLTKH